MKSRILISALAAAALLLPVLGANWPQWRGPQFNGSNPAASGLAVEWSTDTNVAWRAELPSWSAATPAVWGDTVFVTSAEQGFGSPVPPGRRGGPRGRGPRPGGPGGPGRPGGPPPRGRGGPEAGRGGTPNDGIFLIALNRKDGSIRWNRQVGDGNRIYRKQNLASPSPITDGSHVWVMTGGGQFTCFRMDGEEVWSRNVQQDYGRFGLNHGYASTPRLHLGRLYVQVLHGMKTDDPSYVFAVNARTGETIWRVERPTDAMAESPDDYSTPLVVTVGGRQQLVVSGGDYVTGHDLRTGKELWRMGGFNPRNERAYRTIASSIHIDDTVFTTSTRGNPFIAFKVRGEGWLDDSAKVWENALGSDVPTPTTDGKRVFVVNDRGILNVLDAKTGELLVERKRLEPGTYSSSPLLAEGKIYATNEEGTTTVVDVEGGYKTLAVNRLESHTLASPIAVGGQIFIRTADYLYCIAAD